MQYVIRRIADGYFYRGRGHYPRWVNVVDHANVYITNGAAKSALRWTNAQPTNLEILPVNIALGR